MVFRYLRSLLGSGGRSDAVPAPRLDAAVLAEREKNILVAMHTGDRATVRKLVEQLLDYPEPGFATCFAAGVIALDEKSFGTAVQFLGRACELEPDDPEAQKFHAAALMHCGRNRDAIDFAERAAVRKPTDHQLFNMLCILYMLVERFEDSVRCLNRAIELKPSDLSTLLNIAPVRLRAKVQLCREICTAKSQQVVAQAMRRLLQSERKGDLSPENALVLMSLAAAGAENFAAAQRIAHRFLREDFIETNVADYTAEVCEIAGELDQAIELRKQVMDESSGRTGPRLAWALAKIAHGGKEWFDAWKAADEEFLKMYRSGMPGTVPLWQGGTPKGKKLYVYQDQGFGDALLALRLLREFNNRGGQTVFRVEPGLKDLIASAQGIGEVIEVSRQADPKEFGCTDAAPLFSLIRLLKLRPEDLKAPVLLNAPDGRCHDWQERIKTLSGLRVGAVFSGNPWRHDDWYRSVPPAALKPFQALTDVNWVNLAVDARAERNEAIRMFGMLDPTASLTSFADTASIIEALDVVVAIDCSVAHLASALGKPVLVLLPCFRDWRWQIGEDEHPWWPLARTFRCREPGRWDEPVRAAVAALQDEF